MDTTKAFNETFGFKFGEPHNGKEKSLPSHLKSGQLTTFILRQFDGDEEVLFADWGVNEQGGGVQIEKVEDGLERWDGAGYEAQREAINDLDLDDDEHFCAPRGVGPDKVDLFPDAFLAQTAGELEIRQGSDSHTLTWGSGAKGAGKLLTLTLVASGGGLRLKYVRKKA